MDLFQSNSLLNYDLGSGFRSSHPELNGSLATSSTQITMHNAQHSSSSYGTGAAFASSLLMNGSHVSTVSTPSLQDSHHSYPKTPETTLPSFDVSSHAFKINDFGSMVSSTRSHTQLQNACLSLPSTLNATPAHTTPQYTDPRHASQQQERTPSDGFERDYSASPTFSSPSPPPTLFPQSSPSSPFTQTQGSSAFTLASAQASPFHPSQGVMYTNNAQSSSSTSLSTLGLSGTASYNDMQSTFSYAGMGAGTGVSSHGESHYPSAITQHNSQSQSTHASSGTRPHSAQSCPSPAAMQSHSLRSSHSSHSVHSAQPSVSAASSPAPSLHTSTHSSPTLHNSHNTHSLTSHNTYTHSHHLHPPKHSNKQGRNSSHPHAKDLHFPHPSAKGAFHTVYTITQHNHTSNNTLTQHGNGGHGTGGLQHNGSMGYAGMGAHSAVGQDMLLHHGSSNGSDNGVVSHHGLMQPNAYIPQYQHQQEGVGMGLGGYGGAGVQQYAPSQRQLNIHLHQQQQQFNMQEQQQQQMIGFGTGASMSNVVGTGMGASPYPWAQQHSLPAHAYNSNNAHTHNHSIPSSLPHAITNGNNSGVGICGGGYASHSSYPYGNGNGNGDAHAINNGMGMSVGVGNSPGNAMGYGNGYTGNVHSYQHQHQQQQVSFILPAPSLMPTQNTAPQHHFLSHDTNNYGYGVTQGLLHPPTHTMPANTHVSVANAGNSSLASTLLPFSTSTFSSTALAITNIAPSVGAAPFHPNGGYSNSMGTVGMGMNVSVGVGASLHNGQIAIGNIQAVTEANSSTGAGPGLSTVSMPHVPLAAETTYENPYQHTSPSRSPLLFRDTRPGTRRPREANVRPKAKFIADITLPDRSRVYMGQKLVKVWRLFNAGVKAWPEGTCVMFIRGDASFPDAPVFPVACVAPNESIDVTITLTTPHTTGRCMAVFRLADKDHVPFGPRMWVDLIAVAEGESLHDSDDDASGECYGDLGGYGDGQGPEYDASHCDTLTQSSHGTVSSHGLHHGMRDVCEGSHTGIEGLATHSHSHYGPSPRDNETIAPSTLTFPAPQTQGNDHSDDDTMPSVHSDDETPSSGAISPLYSMSSLSSGLAASLDEALFDNTSFDAAALRTAIAAYEQARERKEIACGEEPDQLEQAVQVQ